MSDSCKKENGMNKKGVMEGNIEEMDGVDGWVRGEVRDEF